jgi:hypothetical protein
VVQKPKASGFLSTCNRHPHHSHNSSALQLRPPQVQLGPTLGRKDSDITLRSHSLTSTISPKLTHCSSRSESPLAGGSNTQEAPTLAKFLPKRESEDACQNLGGQMPLSNQVQTRKTTQQVKQASGHQEQQSSKNHSSGTCCQRPEELRRTLFCILSALLQHPFFQ